MNAARVLAGSTREFAQWQVYLADRLAQALAVEAVDGLVLLDSVPAPERVLFDDTHEGDPGMVVVGFRRTRP